MSYVGRGSNPNSIANLKHEGRPLAEGEPKKGRNITVTDTGWKNAKAIAHSLGIGSVSELIEKIGRSQIKILIADEDHSETVETIN